MSAVALSLGGILQRSCTGRNHLRNGPPVNVFAGGVATYVGLSATHGVGCSANSNDIAEVLLREGGQDDDVMGWGRDELLHDVLDQYERHIHFLNAVR